MGRATRKNKGQFAGIPVSVMKSQKFIKLSHHARALLLELALQYGGHNNGNLTACWTLMKPRGFKSSSTLHAAKKELLEAGFIIVTRQGMKRRGYPTLLALTYQPVDEVAKIEYDIGIKTGGPPLNLWLTSALPS